MSYTKFVIRYTREYDHRWMSDDEMAKAIEIAWRRHLNPPGVDTYTHWMQDIQLELFLKRSLQLIKEQRQRRVGR